MMSDKLIPLIDAIYSAASDPSRWPAVALEIQCAIGGHSVNLALEDTQSPKFSFFYTNGANSSDIEYYERNIIAHDEFGALFDKYTAGSAILTQDFWEEEQLHGIYPYDDFYERLGYAYFNSGLFYRDNEKRGWLSVVRSPRDSLFTLEEHLLMKALIPHLRRAFMINIQMAEAQRASQIGLDCLEHISAAALLLSRKGQVLQHNSRATSYLGGSNKQGGDYRVRLPDPAANQRLQLLILAALETRSHDLPAVLPFSEHGLRKTVLCFPWKASGSQLDWLGETTGCILFILSPSAGSPPAEQLQLTYSLSKAEIRVLQGLIEGATVGELTDQLCVSEATVRFHIRNLLRKSDSRSQAELISKVLRGVSTVIR